MPTASAPSTAFISTANYWNLTDVLQLGPLNSFAIEDLRGYLRTIMFVGQSLPALGLVMQASDDVFTAVSHVYTATLIARATADTPNPSAVFTDRECTFFNRSFDRAPVVAVAWTPGGGDFPSSGYYLLKFKAVNATTGRNFPLPEIEIRALDPL